MLIESANTRPTAPATLMQATLTPMCTTENANSSALVCWRPWPSRTACTNASVTPEGKKILKINSHTRIYSIFIHLHTEHSSLSAIKPLLMCMRLCTSCHTVHTVQGKEQDVDRVAGQYGRCLCFAPSCSIHQSNQGICIWRPE